jgi:cysteine synthase A
MAAKRMQEQIPEGATVALIFPDRGERYLDTIFSNEWVEQHFGGFANVEAEMCATAQTY